MVTHNQKIIFTANSELQFDDCYESSCKFLEIEVCQIGPDAQVENRCSKGRKMLYIHGLEEWIFYKR